MAKTNPIAIQEMTQFIESIRCIVSDADNQKIEATVAIARVGGVCDWYFKKPVNHPKRLLSEATK